MKVATHTGWNSTGGAGDVTVLGRPNQTVGGMPLTYFPQLLSILDGQRRYAHVTGLRGDEVAPQILGMDKIISDESLRRALARLAPTQDKRCGETEQADRQAKLAKSTAWMDAALNESTREALRTPWILDVDTTVKLLYGNQAGAEVGYNPTKPGRPSHTLHTYWISNICMVLDVEVQDGKSGSAKHSLPRMRQLITAHSF